MKLGEIAGIRRKQRVNAAIDYIISDPGHAHTLEELASRSHYSTYHFLRSFNEVTKQTPMQFVSNQRLDRAARILLYNSKLKVTDVGASCGFSSSQHLWKVFKSAHGIGPREISGNFSYLRDKTAPGLLDNKPMHSGSADQDPVGREGRLVRESEITIKDLPDHRVGYFRTVGPYNRQTLDEWFELIVEWKKLRKLQSIVYGVPRSLPALTPNWRCVHDVCVALQDDEDPAPGMSEQMLKGGTCAVYRTEVDNDSLYLHCRKIWTWLTQVWLPSSSFQPDDRPTREAYLRGPYDNHRQAHTIEFCLPIRPLEDIIL